MVDKDSRVKWVAMESHRCKKCGRYWDQERLPGACPLCSAQRIKELEQALSAVEGGKAGMKLIDLQHRIVELEGEVKSLKASANSLRGANTTLRGKLKNAPSGALA